MSRKVFTAGEVLAAADVNSFLMDQTVMSFAGTAARGSAIPTPVEGMTTYREDIDRLETYNGSIYTSPGDLVLVKTQVIGTTVPSVVVTNAFSAAFDDYLIKISGGVNPSGGSNITFQLGSTTANYYSAGFRAAFNSASLIAENQNNESSFSRIARTGSTGYAGEALVSQPFNATRTIWKAFGSSSGLNTDVMFYQNGYQDSNTSFTGFTLTPNFGSLTGGTINVYGFRKTF
jgi:hypothetical protein